GQQPSGKRAVHIDVLLTGRAGRGDLPAGHVFAGESRDLGLNRVSIATGRGPAFTRQLVEVCACALVPPQNRRRVRGTCAHDRTVNTSLPVVPRPSRSAYARAASLSG